mmetsp:Transcript_45099/g.106359  ORF Transcript_45099/g.106359 Transcript_45099/m.106359 type:complete len:202 (-) Transcript_45099:520-1125(-)
MSSSLPCILASTSWLFKDSTWASRRFRTTSVLSSSVLTLLNTPSNSDILCCASRKLWLSVSLCDSAVDFAAKATEISPRSFSFSAEVHSRSATASASRRFSPLSASFSLSLNALVFALSRSTVRRLTVCSRRATCPSSFSLADSRDRTLEPCESMRVCVSRDFPAIVLASICTAIRRFSVSASVRVSRKISSSAVFSLAAA